MVLYTTNCTCLSTKLFDESIAVVVDDAPHVLEKAVEKGVIATGLLFPWNRDYR
jgi:hypothetical protein